MRGTRIVLVAAAADLLSANAAAAALRERVLVFSKAFTVAAPFAGR
jgi:hypothetical protein